MAPSGMAIAPDNATQGGTATVAEESRPSQHEQSPKGTPRTVTGVDDPSHPQHRHRRVVEDFDLSAVLGEGSYSTVLLGRDKKTGKQYAVKKLDKAHIVKNNKVKYVMIERDALSRMNHPGIVRLYWTFSDQYSLYYVLDLVTGGELYTYLRRLAPFDYDTARFYAAEILLAIDYIHKQSVIHRDIKPENILIDNDMHIKITDFGSAKIMQNKDSSENEDKSETKARSFVGTAEYVSPELLRSDPTDREVDYWALGCIVFQMLAGRSPFKAATDYLIFQNVKNLNYTFPDEFPPVAKDLVQKLLVSDPKERLGSDATGGVEALKAHSFFDGIDWDNQFKAKGPPLKERLDALEAAHPEIPKESELDVWFDQPRVDNPFTEHDHVDLVDVSHKEGNNAAVSSAIHEPAPVAHPMQRGSPSITSDLNQTASTRSSVSERRTGATPSLLQLGQNENIVRAGRVIRRGLFSKKRFLVLTSKPRILYLNDGPEQDGAGGTLRCEIECSPKLVPELKSKSVFVINTPKKAYTFEDPHGEAQNWVNAISTMLVNSFGVSA